MTCSKKQDVVLDFFGISEFVSKEVSVTVKLNQAQEIVSNSRLSAVVAKRFDGYVKGLQKPKTKKRFDDRVYRLLCEKTHNLSLVQDTKNYLDGMGYSQGLYDYKFIDAQISNFQEEEIPSRLWNRSLRKAVETVTAECRKANLTSLKYKSTADIKDAIPRKDTHAGWSYIVTGKRHKGEYIEDLLESTQFEIAQAKKVGSFNKPILIGTRNQAGGAFDENGDRTGTWKMKPRLVSMIDIHQIMAETMFATPFTHWLSQQEWYAGGKDDTAINAIVQKYRAIGYHMLTVDYSKYDQSITSWMIHVAFDIIRESFHSDPNFDEELFHIIRMDFIHKVFIDGTGQLRYASHGVPSGSMFTQIVDSIVNRVMILTYANAKKVRIHAMIIMGDDNLIFSVEQIDTKDLAGYLKRMFNAVVNDDKCSYTKPHGYPEFLSREWRPQGVYRKPEVLIMKAIYPENFRPYKQVADLSPEQIIYAYYKTFPLGMAEIIDANELDRMRHKCTKGKIKKAMQWMTGIERYRALYLDSRAA